MKRLPRASLLLAPLAALSLGCAGWPAPERGAIRVLPDVPYVERPSGLLALDVVAPAGGGVRAAVLVLHPGGWTGGARQHVAGIARELAKAGFVAIAPSYRLAPEHPHPAQLEDVAEAVRFVRRHARSLGVDPDRVGAFGYSAGAHLAALLGTAPPEGARLQAVAVGGTPADLGALRPNRKTRALLGGDAVDLPDAYAAASPVSHASADDPPFLILHGRTDAMISPSQAQGLQRALSRAGVPVRVQLGWLGHFATFLFQKGGVGEAVPFFAHWLRSETALAQTRARADGTERRQALTAESSAATEPL